MATTSTTASHYGAQIVDDLDPLSGGSGPIWRDCLDGTYETDPDALAAVLPPPLEPTDDPVVRYSIAVGTMPDGSSFGEARVTVRAQHGTVVGEYPILVVHDTEWALAEGRDRFGEPAKLGEIDAAIDRRRVDYTVSRRGQRVAQVVGVVDGPQPTKSSVRTEFCFRTVRSLRRPLALAEDPELVLVSRTIEERRAASVGGIIRPGSSPFDPIRELPLRRTIGARLSQQFVTLSARSAGTVPAAAHLPYIHHRYDPVPVPDRTG